MTGSNSSRLYPWAEAMRAELDAVPWVLGPHYGVAPHRDQGELACMVAKIHSELARVVATHPAPHVRRIYRGLRSPLAELGRQCRLPATRRRAAFINTLCDRLGAALGTFTDD